MEEQIRNNLTILNDLPVGYIRLKIIIYDVWECLEYFMASVAERKQNEGC